MGCSLAIAKELLAEIGARAAASPDEVCGLLLGRDGTVAVVHCRNVASEPATAFEIDPAQLIAALRAERDGGPRVIGCYHSHPSGDPVPSRRDAADAAPNGWWWLIVGGSDVQLFQAVKAGAIHGRFDPFVIPALSRYPASSAGQGLRPPARDFTTPP